MTKILSIDPSGTGTTGVYFKDGREEGFNSYKHKDWQEHYNFIVSLVKLYRPQVLFYEHTNYINLKGKDMTSLFKLLGALETLPVQQIKSVPVNQVKALRGKLVKGIKKIANLDYQVGRGKGWTFKNQKLNLHELDAYLIYYLEKNHT